MKIHFHWRPLCCAIVLAAFAFQLLLARVSAAEPAADPQLLRRENLAAWCIVPFDAAKRSPAERAAMLKELGLTRCAYDWRGEHVASFEEEIRQYQKHGIEFFAFWDSHETAFELFKKYDIHPQIWKTAPSPPGDSQAARVAAAAEALTPLAARTREIGCPLGLYNHGGWGGEPVNLVAVCQKLREAGHDHVGIVYNWHHGHGHIADWAELLKLMQPYLICLNLNGMNAAGEPKILPIGRGEHELAMLRELVASGYQGPLGVIDHREELDARESLLENLNGLETLRQQLAAEAAPSATEPSDAQADLPYSATLAAALAADCRSQGDPLRGAAVFGAARSACVSCHRIGSQGGSIGPDLAALARERELTHLIESVVWPRREVKPEYMVWKVLTVDGQVLSGYKTGETDDSISIREPAGAAARQIPRAAIEEMLPGSTPMPDGLTAGMTRQQQLDLFAFLDDLRRADSGRIAQFEAVLKHAQHHGPATFEYERAPLSPADWPHWEAHVNRDRLYDFYTKQAEHFRREHGAPLLLAPFPGLDNGKYGHWGNQKEETWADDRWNEVQLGSLQSGVWHGDGRTVPRAVCLQLGEPAERFACFNADTLSYEAVWSARFLKFSAVRHGFMHGLLLAGDLQPHNLPQPAAGAAKYRGYYRIGKQVKFAYRLGEQEYLDSLWSSDGKLVREVVPRDDSLLEAELAAARPQWPEVIETRITRGGGRPYAVDTIELPTTNPWNALVFCSGHDFLADGAALVCTMHGDVWRVEGLDGERARWRRFASGLHQPLGLVVTPSGEIFVQCRDQLTRLHDLNGDGEADFYECFSKAFETSTAGHDYICGLQRDAQGNFYTASGNQGLIRISPDGARAEVLATGFRNPDGLGLYPDGTITVPCSEGNWTPASMICGVKPLPQSDRGSTMPHFGYGGPRDGQPPDLPLVYVPRGIDNSAGGQVYVASDRWGPLQGRVVHLSFGAGSHMLLLRDQVGDRQQGAIVPLAGEFLSGAHRGRFNPRDGQLYVSGMAGWGSYTLEDGCFHRVRYTGDPVQMPIGFHVHENGIAVKFSLPLEKSIAEQVSSHYAQCWNYRYSEAYGSPEYSPSHYGVPGHDPLVIASAHVLPDGHTLFLELPDLQPVNQLHLRMHVDSGEGHDLFATVHALAEPLQAFPGYRPREKVVAAHPLLADLAFQQARVPNPWQELISGSRSIVVETGTNLTFVTRTLHVKAGEPLRLTLHNPDVVPHNWALVEPGSLSKVGDMANRLIADPEAVARHYIPQTSEVLAHTDVVPPGKRFTIHLHAPAKPGRYPYLCTFPGHSMVMNGTMIVE